MTKMSNATIEKYQDLLLKDPNSLAFAALSESYREMGLIDQAENVARDGIQRHPQYAGGYMTLGRILFDRKKYSDAVVLFEKVSELDSQNLLGFWFQGQCHLILNNPKQALKCFKYVLFINPLHEKARRAIEKLESLTADEYEEDVFKMQPLQSSGSSAVVSGSMGQSSANFQGGQQNQSQKNDAAQIEKQEVQKRLSLIDAYLVRNDYKKAREILTASERDFPNNSEITARWDLFDQNTFEIPAKIMPNMSREKEIIDLKIKKLENLLLTLKNS